MPLHRIGFAVTPAAMSNIVDALRLELAALEADLANDPRYRKIARISALLAEYEQSMPNDAKSSALSAPQGRCPPTPNGIASTTA